MKKLIIALILAAFIISLFFLPKGNPISAQGGYAYGAGVHLNNISAYNEGKTAEPAPTSNITPWKDTYEVKQRWEYRIIAKGI